ncbi:MAG TPA: hypothetical protein GX709_02370 [Clostridiales bacterium]|nr:hypothetical protein [Clostridiales bacterium]
MIKIIYGAKGSGKTKKIIEMANDSIAKELGDIVFIADTSRYIHEIKYQIRFTNTKESNIKSEDGFIGFIQGMQEANYDIRLFFIDGLARMIGKSIAEMKSCFDRLIQISNKTEATFVLTISEDYEKLPDFIKQFIDKKD